MKKSTLRWRYWHFLLAPIMFIPLFVTALTGSLFQVAVISDRSQDFLWLLEIHRGKFGAINLESIYPFINAFGVLFLAITGIGIWLQTKKKTRKQKN